MPRLTKESTQDVGAGRLRSIFEALPAGVVVLDGPEHVVEYANDLYRRIVGGREIVGLPIREALPEVEGQGFFETLDRVYSSGEPYHGHEERVVLARGGELEEAFFTFAYLPTRGEDGEIDGVFAHVVEVTELVRARRRVETLALEVETERARLEALVEQLPAGVVIGEAPSGRLTLANRVWRDYFGLPLERIETIRDYGAFVGYDAAGNQVAPGDYPLARTIETGEPVAGEEIEFVRPDGRRRTLEITAAPLREQDGSYSSAVATFFDTTERRRAERLVEGQRRVLEAITAGEPLHVALEMLVRTIERYAERDLLGSILLLDENGRHLLHGAAPSLPQPYNDAIHGIEIGPKVGSCGTAAFTGERVVVTDIEHDPLWEDFRELALEHGLRACWSTPIRSSGGDVLGTFAIYYPEAQEPLPEHEALVDLVTRTAAIGIERRRLEEERLELLERERAAREEAEAQARASVSLAYVADGVCLVDNEGVVRLWNPAAERILAVEAAEAVGRPLLDVVPGWRRFVERTAGGEGSATVPVDHLGHELWLSVSAVAFDEGTVYAFRDVSDDRRLEQVRADIVATVSHELRTPLAAVYGAAKTLERLQPESPQAPALLGMIGTEAERLRLLIDEILLASQLEGGTPVRLERDRFDAAALLHELAAALAPPHGVTIEVDATEPAEVDADEARVRQVLANLLDNALKYGSSGGLVRARVGRRSDCVLIEISDRGPGIPRHEQERVFEKFHRLDPEQRRGIGGTGLGLYIARELVLRMGGRIDVRSREGEGATFAVELPAAG